jgi:hypothetical protein
MLTDRGCSECHACPALCAKKLGPRALKVIWRGRALLTCKSLQ